MTTANAQLPSLDAILDKQAIATLFQPVVSLRKRSIIGFEALSRGINPDTGQIIMPNDLFALAAVSGKVLDLDRLCREKAFHNFTRILDLDQQSLLFVNLDASIIDMGVVGSGHMLQAVRNAGLQPSSIVIELLESRVVDINALKKFISTHRDYGFLIALDDIGNGHSNLDRIFHVRPDIIKIDRSLVSAIERDYYKQELFKALVGLSRKIGALVIAEGVETQEEAKACLEFGADMLQGYFFNRPKPFPAALLEIDSGKFGQVFTDYMKSKIEKISAEQSRNNTYEDTLAFSTRELAAARPDTFAATLRVIAAKLSSVQSFYILDMAGIQLTDTIETASETNQRRNPIFQAAFKGADQSLRDYYIFIHAGLARHITAPYMSMANGKLCVTGSTVFTDHGGTSYILCIDFNP